MSTPVEIPHSPKRTLWGFLFGTSLAVTIVSLIIAFRRPITNQVRFLNRRFYNPLVLRVAGRSGNMYAVIRHTGRKSGNNYTTPVVVSRTEGGFLIPLAYGYHVDWCRNLLVAGQGEILFDGKTYLVRDPEIISATIADAYLPVMNRISRRFFGVQEFLHVRVVPTPSQVEVGE